MHQYTLHQSKRSEERHIVMCLGKVVGDCGLWTVGTEVMRQCRDSALTNGPTGTRWIRSYGQYLSKTRLFWTANTERE